MKVILLSFLVFLSTIGLCLSQVLAQTTKVSGRVLDSETQAAVAYASISLQNSYNGTVTDEEGRFQILLPSNGLKHLKISALGYETLTLQANEVSDTILLKPASYKLQEVIVQTASLEARDIVKKAFAAIPKNYHKSPILLETFYRHYCQDDSLYGRIIEATIDIYKKRGYGKRETYEANKDLIRVNELRRSLDNTRFIKTAHAAMALDLLQQSDIVALKEKPRSESKELGLLLDHQNFANPENKSFEFTLNGNTTLDDEEVYEVHFNYSSKPDTKGLNEVTYNGRFFIATEDYAILRFESQAGSTTSNFNQRVSYKKFGNKYALFHSLHKSWNVSRDNKAHRVHAELMVTNLKQEKQKGFNRTEVDREYLATIPYRQAFWENYPLIKSNPVPDSVAHALQTELSLEQQYKDVEQYETRFTNETKKDEQTLLKLIEDNKGILVIDLWAAWCSPCIQEYTLSEHNRKTLKEKGVQFLMVSVDTDLTRWRNTIELYDMVQEQHLKIGPNAKFLRPLNMEGVPRYLVYQGQTLITNKAPKPSTQAFQDLIEGLVTEPLNYR